MELSEEIVELAKNHQDSYKNTLIIALRNLGLHFTPSATASYQQIVEKLRAVCQHPCGDKADQILKLLGVDSNEWKKLETAEERYKLVLHALEKGIEEGKKKVITQIDNYTIKSRECVSVSKVQQNTKDPFGWLKLKNKYPMCEPKLKAKLVQAISDNKNEARIRQRIASPDLIQKVSLLDQSLVLDQYEKIKIDYHWSEEDERTFLSNINSLKTKFNKSEFLKRCGRFKFISQHELETLAAEEISRRLDQNNKVYLSRQFLLDKYYSTTEFLTEQEMRFVLKTSPLLSKCVDKNFIRAAIKNIQYEDINRLELKIAENIISRFDQIRKAVRQSRKLYKQVCNDQIKQRIVEFERRQQFEIIREMARDQLRKHKVMAKCSSKQRPMHLDSKKKYLPLNQYHPPSGLFVKDCNEQCNDDLFNHYEMSYLEKEKKPKKQTKLSRSSVSMVQFYSGGPQVSAPKIPEEAVKAICKLIKAQYYQKSIKQYLNNFQIPTPEASTRTENSKQQQSCYDLDRRPKTIQKMSNQESEALIKRKILQGKQKAKAIVYVNKLLAFAAGNSFTSLKALNAKFTLDQVNSKDFRGNTALYYAAKHQNIEFINYLLNFGADPSISCQKENTPLHFVFKSNNTNIIIRCLCAVKPPNLNALNSENKTPLAYSTHDTLSRLYLQDGVLVVQNRCVQFDNNRLLSQEKLDKLSQSIGWESSRAQAKTKML